MQKNVFFVSLLYYDNKAMPVCICLRVSRGGHNNGKPFSVHPKTLSNKLMHKDLVY